MPGLSQTDDFMLGTATVMLGTQANLFDLNPADHSIGLVKNFTITAEPSYTELTQGVKNTIVHSVLTSNPVRCTMEAYEFTAKNMGYSLGLENADGLDAFTVETTLSADVDGESPTALDIEVASATGLAVNDYIIIMRDTEDDFLIRQIDAIVSTTITTDQFLPSLTSGAVVKKVHALGIGSKDDQPYYGAKIAGKLANGEEVVVLIPKLRIIRGFNVAFSSDDYANMPLEFTVYDLVSTDTFFTEFGTDAAKLFKQ